jgi:hypothetical protein
MIKMVDSVDGVIEYLIENGMDEADVNHYLHEKNYGGKSIMNLIVEKDWNQVWYHINVFIFGDIWMNN